jgi:hypothetical protein
MAPPASLEIEKNKKTEKKVAANGGKRPVNYQTRAANDRPIRRPRKSTAAGALPDLAGGERPWR